ncbi:response regulator [Agrobacterium rosae]
MDKHLQKFDGKRILVLEDDTLLDDKSRRTLEKLGATIAGRTASSEKAILLLEENKVDAAILDVFLDDALVFPIVKTLEELDIPYVFATSYVASVVPDKFSGYVLCAEAEELAKISRGLFSGRQHN